MRQDCRLLDREDVLAVDTGNSKAYLPKCQLITID
jgi:hypothetical protein